MTLSTISECLTWRRNRWHFPKWSVDHTSRWIRSLKTHKACLLLPTLTTAISESGLLASNRGNRVKLNQNSLMSTELLALTTTLWPTMEVVILSLISCFWPTRNYSLTCSTTRSWPTIISFTTWRKETISTRIMRCSSTWWREPHLRIFQSKASTIQRRMRYIASTALAKSLQLRPKPWLKM